MNDLVVPMDDVNRCDFCNRTEVAWLYPAKDFLMIGENWGSEGAWAACQACSDAIETNDHQALVARVMDGFIGPKYVKAEVATRILELHDRFRENRTGDRQAIEDPGRRQQEGLASA